MKFSLLQQNRRSNSFRNTTDPSSTLDPSSKPQTTASFFWLVLHGLCCVISLVLGFRFSRIIFFLLFSSPTTHFTTPTPLFNTQTQITTTQLQEQTTLNRSTTPSSRVIVGRHGILIRPNPHPNPTEVMKAHRILDRVQKQQRFEYGVTKNNPKSLIVITPTYVRTFQTLHLTGLMHSLMLVPYNLVWIVVEAGGVTNETGTILDKSRLQFFHIGFEEKMPVDWAGRHRLEARMRFRALRVVREERMDGIVMFADDSNMHSMELFDEIQSVKWMGAVSVGILAHSGNIGESESLTHKEEDEENLPMPVQGPACNSSGQLIGWHTFNSLPYLEKSATYIDDRAMVLPRKLEWAGFVLNSKLLWKEAEDKPEWVRDLDTLVDDGDALESPLSLLKDASFIEPLGSCGRNVLLWWLRVEARADSKFPPGLVLSYSIIIQLFISLLTCSVLTCHENETSHPWPDTSSPNPTMTKLGTILVIYEIMGPGLVSAPMVCLELQASKVELCGPNVSPTWDSYSVNLMDTMASLFKIGTKAFEGEIPTPLGRNHQPNLNGSQAETVSVLYDHGAWGSLWLRPNLKRLTIYVCSWVIDPPLEITVPAKHTPWPDAPPELPSDDKVSAIQEHTEKHSTKTGRTSRSRHGSRNKRKSEPRIVDSQVSAMHGEEK
ncbi:hypothetical protein IFM89_006620 [Coptis chinensis]|uniref:Glycosyltransferases n=1 Tax=Coptis chinensis TaxID=261450 RepID=A0A835LPR0_9MAGN|nr:hypothetical protein IFM89_006620 [Coptis chinensis]